MTAPENGHHFYDISLAAGVADSIKEFHRRAIANGIGPQVVTAIKRIRQRLRTDPTSFGEPLFHLQAVRLQIRMAIETPLIAYFAIHDDQPWVLIQRIHPLSGHGLD